MRKYIRYRLRCAAIAGGVKPSAHVHLGWEELQIRRKGWKVRAINVAKGTAPKRRWKERIKAVLG